MTDLLARMHERFARAKAAEERARVVRRPACYRCARQSTARLELRDGRALAYVSLCDLHCAAFAAGELVALSRVADAFASAVLA